MSKASKKVVTADMYDVIQSPVVTEKSQMAIEHNKIVFYVSADADKAYIKRAVEALFDTEVEKVNVLNVKGKVKRFRGITGRRKDRKKAIVTLKEGQNIDLTAGK
jgi:large subunit ribosomal protein L23